MFASTDYVHAVAILMLVVAAVAFGLLIWLCRQLDAESKRCKALSDRNKMLSTSCALQSELAQAWESMALMSTFVREYVLALVAVSNVNPIRRPKPAPRRPLATDTVQTDDAGNTIAPGVDSSEAIDGPTALLHAAEQKIVDAARVLVILGGSRSVIVYSLRRVFDHRCSQLASPIKAGLLDVVFGRLTQRIMQLSRPVKKS